MHLKSCCALFLLALVACQAAPSAKIEKSINEAEKTLTETNIPLEDAGSEKDRAKKSATTFCVEVRSGKPEQVPCRQEVDQPRIVQHESKPVVIVQPIPIPAAMQPISIPPTQYQHRVEMLPQPQPSQNYNLIQQQQSQVVPPAPAPQHLPVPAPQVVTPPAPQPPVTPVHQPPPIINIVPQASVAVPCEKQIVQPQQQFHTVHVIHPQPQATPRPSVTLIRQEINPHKEQKLLPPPMPQMLPVPNRKIEYFEQREPVNVCKKCGQRPAYQPFNIFVQPSSLLDMSQQYEEPDKCKTQEEAYECSCRSENRIPTFLPYADSRLRQKPLSRVLTYPSDAMIRSMPYRPAMIAAEANPSTLDQSVFIASDGARDAEARHHKKQYSPVNLSVQLPIVYPASNNPKYYEEYRPAYTNPNPYPNTYPSTYTYGNYENYGNYGTYGTSYPASYDTSASSVPSITVNAGGPFYREAQNIDPSSQSNEIETLPRETLSTAKIDDAFNTQKRDNNLIRNKQADILEERNEGNSINQHN